MTTMATIDRTGRRRIRRIPITRAGILKYYPFLPLLFFGSTPSLLFAELSGKPGSSDAGGTSPAFYAITMFFYLVGLAGGALHWRRQLLPNRTMMLVWVLVIFAVLSFGWSIEPALTLRRAGAAIGMTLVATHVATYPLRTQMATMTLALGTLMIISLFLGIAFPEIGMAKHAGTLVLNGQFVQKNALGWIAAVTAALAYSAGYDNFLGKTTSRVIFILAVAAVILSGSAAGIIGVVAGIAAFHMLQILKDTGRARPLLVIAIVIGFIFAVIFIQLILPVILDYFGKSATLSGRTTIWKMLVPAIYRKLLFGWGFGGAFWGNPISFHYVTLGYWAGNAQGGYVEMLLSYGLFGSAIYALILALPLIRSYRQLMQGDRRAMSGLTVGAVILLLGISAPIFTALNQIYWIFIVMMAVNFGSSAEDGKFRQLRARGARTAAVRSNRESRVGKIL